MKVPRKRRKALKIALAAVVLAALAFCALYRYAVRSIGQAIHQHYFDMESRKTGPRIVKEYDEYDDGSGNIQEK